MAAHTAPPTGETGGSRPPTTSTNHEAAPVRCQAEAPLGSAAPVRTPEEAGTSADSLTDSTTEVCLGGGPGRGGDLTTVDPSKANY